MSLLHQSEGNYAFIPSTAPLYCKGVIADAGYQIVHTILQVPLPYQEGLALVEQHLATLGRPRAALCGVELRCAVPYTEAGWRAPDGFNAEYVALLRNWDLFVAGHNPVARTNVAPTVMPPAEQVLYGFSYTVPAWGASPSFVLSGAGEDPRVYQGDASLAALYAKTENVLAELDERLRVLGVSWDQVTTCDVYTVHNLHAWLESTILAKLGTAAIHGVHWFLSRPPIDNLEIELDARGVLEEQRLVQRGANLLAV
jgi:hypothetical protein